MKPALGDLRFFRRFRMWRFPQRRRSSPHAPPLPSLPRSRSPPLPPPRRSRARSSINHHASIDPPEAELFDSPSTHDATRRQAQAKAYPQPRPRSPTSPAMSSSSNGGKKPATGGGEGGPPSTRSPTSTAGPQASQAPGAAAATPTSPRSTTPAARRGISQSLSAGYVDRLALLVGFPGDRACGCGNRSLLIF